jgi:DNA topoisomerase-2
MILVNGSKGIGTGFSTTIPCYNPLQIITYLIEKLTTGCSTITNSDFIPYYEGFTGTITQGSTPDRFIISGKYDIIGEDRICITELPIGTWTEDYKEFLDSLAQTGVDKTGKKTASIIKDYEDLYTKTKVNFPITLHDKQLSTLTHEQIMTKFKLTTTINTGNMHLFDAQDKLKKYNTVCEIIDDYYIHRLNLYTERKKHIMNIYANQLLILTNKERYISALLTGEIDLRFKKQNVIIELLESHGYQKITSSYDYLLKMPMDSVSDENMDKLSKERIKIAKELEKISNTTEPEMWRNDLVCLESEYKTYLKNRNTTSTLKEVSTKSVKTTTRIIKKKIVV